MLAAGLALVLWTLAAEGQVSVAASDELAAARALYASGDYEGALSRLAAARTERTADEVDQYRALCLLALGRTDETAQSLEELVARRPLFRMSEDDVSPRLVSLFHTVRQRLLPGIIKNLYTRARTSFEAGRHAETSAMLRDMMDLLDDPDVAESATVLADLRLLGDGFLKLAELEIAKQKVAEEAAAAADGPATKSRNNPPPEFYSEADEGIVPPVAVVRTLPAWRPPNPAVGARDYQGHLRVLIDEQGRVASASLIRPFLPGYDDLLVEAARQWQFRPATRGGVPVKFLKLFTIDVSSR